MGKKLLKGKFLLLGTSLLLFGACKAENRETTKLDETFAHFLDEQKNAATDEAKNEMAAANIVTSEAAVMKNSEAAPVEQTKEAVSAESVKMDKATSAVDIDLEKSAKEKDSKKTKKPVTHPIKK